MTRLPRYVIPGQPQHTRKWCLTPFIISVRHHLRVLQAAQRIRHVGPTKGGHWEVLDA
jgi:hypothetical protein